MKILDLLKLFLLHPYWIDPENIEFLDDFDRSIKIKDLIKHLEETGPYPGDQFDSYVYNSSGIYGVDNETSITNRPMFRFNRKKQDKEYFDE